MEPRTKLEKQVMELYKKLAPICNGHKEFAKSKCDHFFTKKRSQLHCLECGQQFQTTEADKDNLEHTTCPNCTKQLTFVKYQKVMKECFYTHEIVTIKEFQVIRLVFVIKSMFLNRPPQFSVVEVACHFINEQGKIISLGRERVNITLCYDDWRINTPMSMKKFAYNILSLAPYALYKVKFAKFLIKRGMTKQYLIYSPIISIKNLLELPHLETLVKLRHPLGKFFMERENVIRYNQSKLDKYWAQIKICIRHNYTITNVKDYFDYINMLDTMGADTYSPRLICPENFAKAHDGAVRKLRLFNRKKKLQELRDKIAEANAIYINDKEKFFSLVAETPTIKIEVLKSVEEFYVAGDKLHHCIFENEYYAKEESLCFAAYVLENGIEKLMETIEFNIDTFEIEQSRGFENKATQFNQEILKVFKENIMPQLKVAA
jgi:hypothetical protein